MAATADLGAVRIHWLTAPRDPDLRLHLAARGDAAERPPILFVHGATFSGRMFDIDASGVNWLRAAAAAGFAAYALDLRGYGRSGDANWRARAFADGAGPACTGPEAIEDIGAAVDFITYRHGRPTALVGWSWGSTTSARYVAGPGRYKVASLVLYAPIFAGRNESWLAELADPETPGQRCPLGPHRRITAEDMRRRWNEQLPPGGDDWREETVLQELARVSLQDDSTARTVTPPGFCAPNGTLVDLWECFSGRPIYDPGKIDCPTLLVRGTQDPTSTRSDMLALFDRLGTAEKQYLEIGNGTHFINAERRAPSLFSAVHAFLHRHGSTTKSTGES
ncbi:alpha/beta hydrolase [Sulfitobacter sp. 1A12126]|uniref:alpha/beta hydrolase n=1 Tax=Sulfitobacter sp. 1A12126 TaxID=3368591 RepID=UPI003744B7CC